jgi:hypothetical protein
MPSEKWTLTKADIKTITIPADPKDNEETPMPEAELADEVAENIQVALGLDVKTVASIRTKEAGDVLSWLNANSCLSFGALPKALAAIEAGKHRR